jgi:hypothetical protein
MFNLSFQRPVVKSFYNTNSKPCITDVLEFTETERILETGMNVNSIFTRGDVKGNLLATY